uniref:Transposase Tc1-like domain-containing protein n=1 Tax=Octopus bimaculoides TaxID=37653 RepID=A0A0L8I0P7_OCTBM
MELSIPQTSIRRIITQIGLKPYRPQLIHGLLEDDPDRQLQFSEIMLKKIEENPGILDNIVWSDEASFKLSGHINRHNCVYWYSENMHLTLEQQLNQPGVNVWGGISSSGVYGPFSFGRNNDRR